MAGLTHSKIEKLKPRQPSPMRRKDGTPILNKDGSPRLNDGSYKRAVGKGLSILVTPAGGKLWRFRWRDATGAERMLSFDSFPDTTLEEAEAKRDEARRIIKAGGDPVAKRRAEKVATANTFEAVAREAIEKRLANRSEGTIERAVWMLETFIYPFIGNKPLDKIEPPDVLAALRRVEARGRHETAKRTRQRVSMVFRYGVATGRCKRDITADLDGALTTPTKKHHARITDPAKIGQLLRDIDGYSGHGVTLYALKIAPYVFVRPGELRHMEWTELHLDGPEPQWVIPAAKMKMRAQHIVPLAKQVVALLRELEALTGPTPQRKGKYAFPALTTPNRPMSENTENTALRRLGYDKDTMTAHGFRGMATTRLREGFNGQRFEKDWVELQLAHAKGDAVQRSYDYAEHLPERRKMMQAWADYIDSLRAAKS